MTRPPSPVPPPPPPAAARDSFVFTPFAGRVIFGSGTRHRLPAELARAGIARAMVLTTPNQAALGQQVVAQLGPVAAGLFAGAAMHTPVDVTASALEAVRAAGVDGLVAIGGGSTIGLAKAVALRTGLPQVALPTTYAGSEMTPILGETENGLKTTRSDPGIQPATVIYDVALTLGLPVGMSVTSGLNAMAHAVEALYAADGNPVVDALALQGIGALTAALPRIRARADDAQGRRDALRGAWLCGTCLGAVGMGLHHKLCHTLGGSFGLPHAETHSVILPHALAYNAPAIGPVMDRLRPILGDDPARGLQRLARDLGAPVALRDLGMPQDGLDRAADLAMTARYPNPRPLDRDAIRRMLDRAWRGDPVQG